MIWMRIFFCFFFVLDIALVAQLGFSDKGGMEYLRLCKTRDQLETRIDMVTRRNLALSDEIRLLKKSPAYAERMACVECNLVDEDEILYLFQPSPNTKTQPSGNGS